MRWEKSQNRIGMRDIPHFLGVRRADLKREMTGHEAKMATAPWSKIVDVFQIVPRNEDPVVESAAIVEKKHKERLLPADDGDAILVEVVEEDADDKSKEEEDVCMVEEIVEEVEEDKKNLLIPRATFDLKFTATGAALQKLLQNPRNTS